MSWETPEPAFICGGIVYPILLSGELGEKHLVNPWAALVGQGMWACCRTLELTHIDMLSRELMPICTQCIIEAEKIARENART